MTSQEQIDRELRNLTARRWFLKQCSVGLGAVACSELLNSTAARAAVPSPVAPKPPHYAPKVKRVIFLFMAGAPSHLELFDHKPELARQDGKFPPAELVQGYRAAFINPHSKLLGPRYNFARYGQCGAELSELIPHVGQVVDDIAMVKSMHTDALNHAPGQILMNTGSQLFGRPSIGAWVSYGLGSESADLPAFVVLNTGTKGTRGGASNWGNAFLPSSHQGVMFRDGVEPVMYAASPKGFDAKLQRDSIDAMRRLNEIKLADAGDPEIAARIQSFETAYRMQTSAPELSDLSNEPQHILDMYGVERGGKPSFASSCLMARRLAERGVRFVQIFHEAWDHHSNLVKGLKEECHKTDQPSAALIKDLKQRGMLDDTLVIWGGEFGRTPMAQGGTDGRDHHPDCFTMWLAGGGIKPGVSIGASDDFGFKITADPVHVSDLHATILHLLGLDHEALTYRFQGRDFRLTDVRGRLIRKILA
jgi:hypothetical protein